MERSTQAEQLLCSSSLAGAVVPIAPYLAPATTGQAKGVSQAPLKGMPQPYVKAGCTLIGLSGPLPGFIRRRELRKHLQHVAREDEALAQAGINELSREELLEATFDRGLGRPDASDAQLRAQLNSWLKLVDSTREVRRQLVDAARGPNSCMRRSMGTT